MREAQDSPCTERHAPDVSDVRRAAEAICDIVSRLKQVRPVVYHITNAVAAGFVADATLAVGASPVMGPSPEESGELAVLASAVVLNLGMPSRESVEAMVTAGRAANERGIPVVLDPVAGGATSFRRTALARILGEVRVSVVRGNSAEVAFLAGMQSSFRGTESAAAGEEPAEVAEVASKKLRVVAAVTGAVDYVSDGRRLASVANGHPVMGETSGTGCVVSALVGAFCAVEPDFFTASLAALACAAVAGEMAVEASRGPGSFRVAWLDALRNLSRDDLQERLRVTIRETA